MLPVQFRAAFRHLAKKRFHTTVSLLSLTLGLSVCLLVGLIVFHEMSYDRFHVAGDRIFRVTVETDFYGKKTLAPTSEKVGPALVASFPELASVVRLKRVPRAVVGANREVMRQEQAFYADSQFFGLFTFPLLAGDPDRALTRPGTVVLTASQATRLFGCTDVLGRCITLNGQSMEITGVAEDPPRKGHLQFQILASMATLEPSMRYNDWTAYSSMTYVKLRSDADIALLSQKVKGLSGNHRQAYGFQPLHRIHLEAHLMWDWFPAAKLSTLWLWGLLAVVVLMLSILNYVNLSTAGASARAPDVAMHKVLGARRCQLVMRFMAETLIMVSMGLLLALLLVCLALPAVRELTGLRISFLLILKPLRLAGVLGLGVVTGGVAGVYPAVMLMRHSVTGLIKRERRAVQGGALRRVLVVAQFGITIALLSSLLMMRHQIQYMRQQPLGFEMRQRLVLPLPESMQQGGDVIALKAECAAVAGVKGATLSRGVPGFPMDYASGNRADAPAGAKRMRIYHQEIDKDFLALYGLKRIAGTLPGPEHGVAPESGVLVNEALVRSLGWPSPEAAVGQRLCTGHFEEGVPIVGVIQDFHFTGLQSEIGPMVLAFWPEMTRFLTLQYVQDSPASVIPALKKIWEEHFPSQPFRYYILKQKFNNYYKQEESMARAMAVYAALAMVIALLGLLGLTVFLTAQRTKEVGIRKVLGASRLTVLWLLSRDYLNSVVLANVLAWPLAWFAVSRWMTLFASRAGVAVGPFVVAGLASLLIAWLGVSLVVWRAVCANPATIIRDTP